MPKCVNLYSRQGMMKKLNLNDLKKELKTLKDEYQKLYAKSWDTMPKYTPHLFGAAQLQRIIQIAHIEGVIAALQDERRGE